MEEQAEQTTTNPKQPALCEECKSNPSKYTCPGCFIRSCSLPCVKAHKQRTACTGKKQLTQFVPISQFDDNLIVSDYNMLEDVKRVAESAQRMRMKLGGYSHFRLPFPLKSLRSAAASRRTKLSFLPSGMSKREKNQTFYNKREKFISWTIEWRFHSTDIVLIDHGVNENTTLCTVLENHLKPGPWNHPLREFCEQPLDSLKIFIRKYPKAPRSASHELDIRAPIREQLANLVILEYPVIHVFLPTHKIDFEIVKDDSRRKPENVSVSRNSPSPKGAIFREEEIEDGGSSEPQVLDLMKHVNSDASHQKKGIKEELKEPPLGSGAQVTEPFYRNDLCIQAGVHTIRSASVTKDPGVFEYQKKGIKKELKEPILGNGAQVTEPFFRNDICTQGGERTIHPASMTKDPGVFEDMDFEFDQGLIDAYSDLITQINPDDFLVWEGVFNKEMELEERREGAFLIEEELEEGEIRES